MFGRQTKYALKPVNIKWSNFSGDGADHELRVGLFLKMGGQFLYKGDELKELNKSSTRSHVIFWGSL